MRYYISDLHFFHKNLLERMDKRPFDSVEEMNEYMIEQWNKKVKNRNDEVVIIGDLSYGNGLQTNEILKSLNGKKMLIEGNHDWKFLNDRQFDKKLFQWIQPYCELNDNKRKVILSHYPTFCYNGQYRRDENGNPSTYMLYGHIHITKDQELIDSFVKQTQETQTISARKTVAENIPCNMINCFCMYSDYQPLTLDEWIDLNRKRITYGTFNIIKRRS